MRYSTLSSPKGKALLAALCVSRCRAIIPSCVLALIVFLAQSAGATPIITGVVETGGDNEATDTITAKWSGSTFTVSVANEPVPGAVIGDSYTVGLFTTNAPCFVDRNHRYSPATVSLPIPAYLIGGEYIMNGNDNRDNATMTMDVTVSAPVRVFLLIDNRLGDASTANPPTFDATHMQWVLDDGWRPFKTGLNQLGDVNLPDEVGIDEGADGTINNQYSVYWKDFPAGTFRIKQADNAGQNMYGTVVTRVPETKTLWACGRDDNGWPAGDGGAANATFVQENGFINVLPGIATSPEADQQADNDYYFAGSYTTVIPANGAYAPVGVVPFNEEAAERAFAAADNDLRYHFNLPSSLKPFDQLSVTFDANNLHDGNPDTRYGIEVYINNVLVQTQIVIRAAQLDTDYTTPPVSLASVGALVGPGYDNIVSLRGINYNNDGGGNWMGIDYVQLTALATPNPLVAVGLNFAADEIAGAGSALAPSDIAGALPQGNWNNLTGASGSAAALVEDSAGTATPTTISVTWSSPNTWSSTGRGEENNGFAAGPDRQLMTGYIDTGNSAATIATVTVSGIPTEFSSGGYDVLVYCLGGVAGRGGAYTIGGETKYGTSPANPSAHVEDPGVGLADTGTYVRFRSQFGSSFTLVASADPALGGGVNLRAPINAIQIVKSQDPDAGLVRGYLTKRRYDDIGASVALVDLLNNPKYINDQADFSCLRTDFSANDANECNNCGLVVRGFFIPKTSGPHVFYMASDDGGGLFLSTDESPAHKAQIASEPVWTGRRDFVGEAAGGGRGDPPLNVSAPITLIAGNKYYIEGAVKEGGGGDNLDVAVQGPGDPAVADGDRPIFGDRIATTVDLTGSSLAITQNPASAQIPEGDAVSFTVAVAATSPLCGAQTAYQWQRKGSGDADFSDIPGANSATYTFGPVRVEDHFSNYRALVTIPGITRTSAAATLEVLGRDCLRVVSAVGSADFTHLIVTFSTFINQTNVSTTDTFNYTVNASGTVVTGLRFTTANDSPNRDPMTFTLEGTAGDPASGPWTLIASGNTGLDTARFATAPDVHFPNTGAYRSYRLLFPTVRDAATANSMQIAEVVFLDAANNDVTVPGNAVLGVRATAGSAASEIAVAGTVGDANNYPAAESPDKSIDDNTATKYLNFAKLNTGIIVTPADPGGTLSVSAVAVGGDGKSVILTTDPQVENGLYIVSVENVESLVGSPLCAAPTNQALARAFVSGCGGAILEAFNLPGGGVAVSQLTSSPNFPNSPDFRGPISSFDIRVAVDPANPSFYSTDARENYGGRLRGFFIAPESGPHTFYFASDDNGELWLSTDERPSHKVMIARETVWSSTKQWTASGGGSSLVAGGKKSAPINLQAGRAYYLEALYHEGGGGDNCAVAVQRPSQATPPAEGADAIPAALLGAAAPVGALGFVTIGQQPASQTLAENSSVTFTVGVNAPVIEDFPLPVCYQWYRDGVQIPGATGPSYSFVPATLGDNGARFKVAVSVIGSQTTSADAVLTVFSDTNAPTCVSATAALSLSNIVVRFSEFMLPGEVQDTFSWTVPGFTVVGAVLGADQMTVTLGLDGLMTPGANYSVTVGGVKDLAGNLIDPDPCTLNFTAPVISCGFVQQNIYLNIGGVAVADLLSNPNYPNNPDIIRYQSLIEANTFDEFENYGTRLSGWLRPPVSGNYNFFMSSDDGGAFYLSTDATPASLVLVASEPVWNGRRDWTGTVRRNAAAPENRSSTLFPAGIPLTAGSMYYFEAFMKEGGGGDNLAVAWQIPGQPVPANGSSPIAGTFLASLAQASGASINITLQPTASTVCLPIPGISNSPPATVNFSVAGTGTTAGNPNVTPFIQWQKSVGGGAFADILGATGPNLSFTPTLADNGNCYRAVFYVPGATATSESACLTVNQGNTPPSFVCGTNQNVLQDAGPQSVPGWATGISPDSINALLGSFSAAFEGNPTQTTITYASDFSSLPPGSEVGGNAVVTGGALHLTDAVNSQQGSWASPAVAGVVNSFTATFKVRVGGGTCCGARTADGWTFNYGAISTPVSFPVAAEEGAAGANLIVSFDSWDNTGIDDAQVAPNMDIKVGGVVLAYQALEGVREGGRPPSGPLINDPATGLPMTYNTGDNFAEVRVHLDADGTLDVDFKGVRIFDNLPTGITPLTNPRVAFGARTGGANDNHWIDDLNIVAEGIAAVPPPPGSALYGNAYIGAGLGNGRLHLTDAVNGQIGSFIVNDLLNGAALGSFNMTFDALVGQGTAPPADGFSVSVANDLPNGPIGEEGDGSGLRVAFDSFDNGGGEAPAIDVYWGGVVIAHTAVPTGLETGGNFVPVIIKLDPDGTLDVTAAGQAVYVNLATGYVPIAGARFGLGGRTGGLNENNWIDNLNISAVAVNPGDAEANQTVQFMVSNSNPALFSGQPAVSPNGTLTYTPAPNACGSAQVTVVAKDNGGTGVCGGQDTSGPCTFTINVDCCPTANAQSVATGEDTSIGITLSGSDPEGSALTYSIATSPAHGTLTGIPPNVTYTPAVNYCGPDGFTFSVSDPGCTRTATVAINVICSNDCPVAAPVSATGNSGAAIPVQLAGSDVDGNALAYNIVTSPAHGSLNPPSGTTSNRTYTSVAGYSGQDCFTYTVSDGLCTSPPATVCIQVNPVSSNSCPVAHAQVLHPCSVPDPDGLVILSADNEEGCMILDGSLSTDADGNPLTYAWYLDDCSTPFARGVTVSNCFDLGPHTIRLVVDDGTCVGTDTIEFDIITACEAVEDLIHDINNCNLLRRNKRPLLAALKAVCATFECKRRGHSASALSQLQVFQSKVRAQISHRNPVEAARFIAAAQDIIDALRCSRALDSAIDSGHGDNGHGHGDDDDDDDDDDNGHGNGNGHGNDNGGDHWWW